MKTLYRKFIIATLLILGISIVIAFILANWVYMTSTKERIDSQNVKVAEEVASSLEQMHSTSHLSFTGYLDSISKLGYQIYVLSESGEEFEFGEPFSKKNLPAEAKRVIEQKKIYHGMDSSASPWMMSHFSNQLGNTVGVPFTIGDEDYGLYLRPNNKLLFSDVHVIFAWFFVAVSIVSITGVIWFAKHLIQPITKLTEATREITRENFNFPLNIHRKDEIGQLAESFSTMQVQLQHNDEARKSFINNVSHDFQSPLMNIQGYAELLKTQALDDEHREYVEIIDQESKRLSNLTKQLLLLTSLDQKSYPMKRGITRIDTQIKETVRRHQWRLEEKEIEISYHLPPATILADPELLMTVWDNLLTNAIKYNQPEGSIFIQLAQTDEAINITFKDSGIGMSLDQASKIFERFYRVDAARKKDGTGLGLSIVKHIIELHNGKIEVESEIQKGTTFTIKLPIEKQTEE
ncbi:HAMP domain-containing sensor histidine kinase [Mesobacillus sp. AQ2]|uniref:HAMP domain-containing sensor histidine kinase n=1 Tax=Mesobacillus sp. AQ2 TaxID=3043332 RepID=UPI0024C12E12|nr:HAMP domain-containing sensor histidine kinase [Mesobacillus sp. AQ2]WHX42632.1 HAMP domain-containing sensor histidine kinase [Mesobacillus sp. AQ2]